MPASTRDRICWATIAVIAADGVDGVRNRRVAAVAGVSLGSTTYYFADREELVREAFRWYLAHAGDAIARLRTADVDRVRAVTRLLVAVLEQEARALGVLRAEYELLLLASQDPALGDDVRAWERRQRRLLASDLATAGCPEPRRGAAVLLALLRGLEVELLLHGPLSTRELRARIAPVVTALCRP